MDPTRKQLERADSDLLFLTVNCRDEPEVTAGRIAEIVADPYRATIILGGLACGFRAQIDGLIAGSTVTLEEALMTLLDGIHQSRGE